ncbi:hypothetical protein D3C86_1352890 [compost metagenome]
MRLFTRSYAAHDTSGPTSTPFSVPAPIFSVLAFSMSSGTQLRASPTSTATDTAMQR